MVGGPGIAERIGPGVKAPCDSSVRRLRESLGDTYGFGRRADVQCEVGRRSRKRIGRYRHGGLTKESVANVTQLQTIERSDLDDKLGKLPRQIMRDIDAGLRRVLDL